MCLPTLGPSWSVRPTPLKCDEASEDRSTDDQPGLWAWGIISAMSNVMTSPAMAPSSMIPNKTTPARCSPPFQNEKEAPWDGASFVSFTAWQRTDRHTPTRDEPSVTAARVPL